MKILTLLFALALAFPALGQELEYFPGWKVDKIEQEQADDGSYNSGPEFYGLKPPDERPAISIDSRTAKQLITGQAQPEEVYGRGAPKKGNEKAESSDEQYVYSAGNNGFVQADEIASTLPGYQPVVTSDAVALKRNGESFDAGDTGSYGGASMAGSSAYDSSGGYAGENGYASSASSVSSGGMSPELARQAAAASPAAAQAAAKEASKGRELASNGSGLNAQNSLLSGGLNTAGGSAASGADATGSNGTKNGTKGRPDSASNSSRDDEDAPPPPCTRGRFVYDRPTLVRLKLPDGCGLIHITAWGAGGGSGKQTYSQGRDGGEAIRTVPGVAGSFMSTSWEIEARKYDLVVVVGEAGNEAVQKTIQVKDDSGDHGSQTRTVTVLEGGSGGFPEGSNGTARGSGGGGGYSGVFLIPKSDGSKTLNRNRAMAVGAGGAGGNGGGGGGGGSMNVPSTAPDARMTNQIGEKARGTKAGYHYLPGRGNAATPGNHGKVIVEYF